MNIQHIGRLLIAAGFFLAALGAVLMLSGRVSWLGRLPGDLMFQRRNFTIYFPLATSLLVSIILTLLFWLFGRR